MHYTHFFIDGACSGNPGPGGWGLIEITSTQVNEFGGSGSHTTNNRMEMMAALAALKRLPEGAHGVLHCDSQYVIRGMTQWYLNWQKNGWRSSKGDKVANEDLWKRLLEASQGRILHWKHVKGHSDHPGNDRADEIAVAFSKNNPLSLFQGSRQDYSRQILQTLDQFTIS